MIRCIAQAQLPPERAVRAAAAHAVAPHAGSWLEAPLDTLISTQRAALLPPIDGDGDGNDDKVGDDDSIGDDNSDLGGATALEESPVDVEEAAVAALQHPGRVLSCYKTRQAALQTYIGQPPAWSLAGSTFWGEDHDSAETQLRSFATACHLPREQRLAALQTRSTLERLETALVALSSRCRRLRLEVAMCSDGSSS